MGRGLRSRPLSPPLIFLACEEPHDGTQASAGVAAGATSSDEAARRESDSHFLGASSPDSFPPKCFALGRLSRFSSNGISLRSDEAEMKKIQRSGQAHFLGDSSPDTFPPDRFALRRSRV